MNTNFVIEWWNRGIPLPRSYKDVRRILAYSSWVPLRSSRRQDYSVRVPKSVLFKTTCELKWRKLAVNGKTAIQDSGWPMEWLFQSPNIAKKTRGKRLTPGVHFFVKIGRIFLRVFYRLLWSVWHDNLLILCSYETFIAYFQNMHAIW